MKDLAQSAPRDLHSIQYAAWLCENAIGMPANKSNMQIIADAIDSIAKSKFREAKWKRPIFTAFLWLEKRIEYAKLAKIPTNHLFFLNGDYLIVPDPEPKIKPFRACRECNEGWKYELKDGQSTGRVEACECRMKWIAEAKK
jgi:hypothetical protein